MRAKPTIFRGDLLIDGYNLLHAAGLARRTYGPGEFERTRQRLLKLVAGQLLARERERTTVVFDAPQQSLGPSPPRVIYGIRVIFAGGEGDADAVIERLIESNTAPRRLHVISSDHRIQRAARRRRSKFYDSEQFLDRIFRRRGPDERARRAEPIEKQQGLTAPGEIEAWMRAFGDVGPVTDEAAPQQDRNDKPPQPSRKSRSTDVSPAGWSEQSATPRGKPDGRSAERGELTFWEKRIAELWEQPDAAERPPHD